MQHRRCLIAELKKGKKNIVYAWLLVVLFSTGQYMVFAHTHFKPSVNLSKAKTSKAIFKERCDVCDAMHHTYMLFQQQVYFQPVAVCVHFYQDRTPDFEPIQLILASGRAPAIS